MATDRESLGRILRDLLRSSTLTEERVVRAELLPGMTNVVRLLEGGT